MDMFVSEKVINEIANDVLVMFEVGDWNSRTPVRKMIPGVLDELADRGLPRRRSLAGLIAKVAAATWAETVLATKMKLEA